MRISYSSSMCVRTRCKRCLSEPLYYLYLLDKTPSKNLIPSIYKSKIFSNFTHVNPSSFKSVSQFSSFAASYNKVSPRYFQTNKNNFTSSKVKVLISLTCKCGKTSWLLPNEKKKNKADKYFDKDLKYLL